jgi:hypothetical protein
MNQNSPIRDFQAWEFFRAGWEAKEAADERGKHTTRR